MNNPSSDVGYLPMGFLVQKGWALRPFHTMDTIASAVDWVSNRNQTVGLYC